MQKLLLIISVVFFFSTAAPLGYGTTVVTMAGDTDPPPGFFSHPPTAIDFDACAADGGVPPEITLASGIVISDDCHDPRFHAGDIDYAQDSPTSSVWAKAQDGIVFTFEEPILPTEVGVVFTDGSHLTGVYVTFEAWDGPDATGTLLASVTAFRGDDGTFLLNFGDDCFFGIKDAGQIRSIRLWYDDPQWGMEMDLLRIYPYPGRPPAVKIIGPVTNLLCNPVHSSPKVVLSTQADPLGGEYEWQILAGQDKVRFIGNTRSEAVKVQGIAPSEEKNDVLIKVTYTVNSQACEAAHYITVQKPTSLSVLDVDTVVQHDDDGQVVDYMTTYVLQVMDQLDHPIHAEMRVAEFWHLFCTNVWHALLKPLYFRSFFTDEGIFADDLQPPLKRFGPPIPPDLLIKVQQRVWAAGWPIGLRCLNFYYGYATSEEGRCTACR